MPLDKPCSVCKATKPVDLGCTDDPIRLILTCRPVIGSIESEAEYRKGSYRYRHIALCTSDWLLGETDLSQFLEDSAPSKRCESMRRYWMKGSEGTYDVLQLEVASPTAVVNAPVMHLFSSIISLNPTSNITKAAMAEKSNHSKCRDRLSFRSKKTNSQSSSRSTIPVPTSQPVQAGPSSVSLLAPSPWERVHCGRFDCR